MKGCTNLLRNKVDNKEVIIFGCVMDNSSGAAIEAYNAAGFDAVMIDREHTYLNSETIRDHIRLCRALNFPCMVRVAEDSYSEFNRALDQAPDGVFVPRITDRAQVERIVEFIKYPPVGKRGLGASTCPVAKYTGWDTVQQQIEYVNKTQVLGIQIETAEALDNLEDILSVEQVDMAIIGPDDLCIGMGIPGQKEHPDFIAQVERILKVCEKYNVLPGIATGDTKQVLKFKDMGYKAFWVASEVVYIWQGAMRQMQELRNTGNVTGKSCY